MPKKSKGGEPTVAAVKSLLHGGKPGIGRDGGKKLHVLVRIETKMFDDQPCRGFKGAAESVEPNGLAFKLLDRFELGPGDERNGSSRQVTGHDLERKSPDRRADPVSNHRVVIEFSAD